MNSHYRSGCSPIYFRWKEDRLCGLSGHRSFTQGYYEICRAREQRVPAREAEVQHTVQMVLVCLVEQSQQSLIFITWGECGVQGVDTITWTPAQVNAVQYSTAAEKHAALVKTYEQLHNTLCDCDWVETLFTGNRIYFLFIDLTVSINGRSMFPNMLFTTVLLPFQINVYIIDR